MTIQTSIMYMTHLEFLAGNNIASIGATFPEKSGMESRECEWSGWEGEVAWVWREWQWEGPLVVDGETLVVKKCGELNKSLVLEPMAPLGASRARCQFYDTASLVRRR